MSRDRRSPRQPLRFIRKHRSQSTLLVLPRFSSTFFCFVFFFHFLFSIRFLFILALLPSFLFLSLLFFGVCVCVCVCAPIRYVTGGPSKKKKKNSVKKNQVLVTTYLLSFIFFFYFFGISKKNAKERRIKTVEGRTGRVKVRSMFFCFVCLFVLFCFLLVFFFCVGAAV